MEDNEKRREQLFDELKKPRSQNATLEKSMTGVISYELVTEESRRYVESIVETIQEPLLVIDVNLKIISDFILGKWKSLEQVTIKTERGIVCLTKILKRATT